MLLFEYHEISDARMPDVAVADLGALPGDLSPTATRAAWTAGWADGGPAWVAAAHEGLVGFKERIIASCQATGKSGIVHIWQRSGFWGRNQDGKLL